MVRAVKRKHADLADKTSLSAMTPDDIKLMNAEFGQIASTPKLADRMSKNASPLSARGVAVPGVTLA